MNNFRKTLAAGMLSLPFVQVADAQEPTPEPNSRAAIEYLVKDSYAKCTSTDTGACTVALKDGVSELYIQWRNSMANHLNSSVWGQIMGSASIGLHASQLDTACYALSTDLHYPSLKEAMNDISIRASGCLEQIKTGLVGFPKIETNVTPDDVKYYNILAGKISHHEGTQGPIEIPPQQKLDL